MSELADILDEAEVERLIAERESLRVQRDAVAARMDEIDHALVASGEARLRERRRSPVPARELLAQTLEQASELGLIGGGETSHA